MLKLFAGSTPGYRRYIARTAAFMSLYTAINLLAIFGVFDRIVGQPIGWTLALAVAAPVLGQIWATLALLRESDEFLRAIATKIFVLGTGWTLALASAWGFGESYAGAPHIEAWLIYPLFWACCGLVTPFVRDSK